MNYLTEKQQDIVDKFKANVDKGLKGTTGFDRNDYFHLKVIKEKCLHILKYHEEAKQLLVYLEEN